MKKRSVLLGISILVAFIVTGYGYTGSAYANNLSFGFTFGYDYPRSYGYYGYSYPWYGYNYGYSYPWYYDAYPYKYKHHRWYGHRYWDRHHDWRGHRGWDGHRGSSKHYRYWR